MQCTIQSPGIQVDDKLKDLLQTKFENFGKIFERVTECLVVLKKENDDRKKYFHVEARLAVPQKTLFAHEHAETFETAVHLVIDDLTHQLRKYKEERDETW